MKDKKVFLVTSGNYSDYEVCAVFTEESLAKRFINSFEKSQTDKLRIKIYSLNPCQYELKEGYKPFFLRMTKEGSCIEIRAADSYYGFEDGAPCTGFDIKGDMFMTVFAKDEKHAIKIANEKRAMLIAEDCWGNKQIKL